MNFFALLKKEWLEAIRSKKLVVLGVLFLFVAITSPILAKITPELLKAIPQTPGISISLPDPTWRDSIDQLIKNLSQIAVIVIVFAFAGAVAEEKNKKTLEMVLSKPVSRAKLILAKYGIAFIVSKVIFLISLAIFYSYTVSLFGSFSVMNFVILGFFLLLFFFLIISSTIFASVISNNSLLASGIAFGIEIAIVLVAGYIKGISDYSPNYVLGHYKELMAEGISRDFLPSIITTIVLIAVFVYLSVVIFRRQEIER